MVMDLLHCVVPVLIGPTHVMNTKKIAMSA